TVGHQVDGGKAWELEIHGWIFERDWEGAALTHLAARIGLQGLTAENQALFRSRAGPLLVDNERGEDIRIRIGEQVHDLGTSRPNGHFDGRVRISAQDVREHLTTDPGNRAYLEFEAVTDRDDDRRFEGRVWLVPEIGITVISDIDDTIKISDAKDRKALLRNTFLKPFREVGGMADLYQAWARRKDLRFHYVSASPWQLFGPLDEFLRSAGFPAGPMSLKPFRWKDETFLDLFKSPMQYKLDVIEPIIKRFPKRQFVLLGDSGEKDPEAYGELARRYPDQVIRVFVRDVTGEASNSERYLGAFRDIPKARWKIFEDPRDIRGSLP
ncbi:MAG: DUF2183 domain-containing protein, partial [Planctomycetota bacterium]|nr:DUF2183 domain-containing protein [Planctomycetota bacterium]